MGIMLAVVDMSTAAQPAFYRMGKGRCSCRWVLAKVDTDADIQSYAEQAQIGDSELEI